MPITPNAVVASEIRAEMARQHRRQSDLVDLLHITQSGVSARLNGRVALSLNEVVAIAAWLDVDPSTWVRQAATPAEVAS